MTTVRITRAGILAILVVALAIVAPGCAGKKKKGFDAGSALTVTEAYAQGMALLETGQLPKALSALERIEFTPESREVYEPLVKLAIADATFYSGGDIDLIDARALYLNFVALYGDHPRAPYAQMQAGVCSLRQVNHPARDQGQTVTAIQDFAGVLGRYPASAYAQVTRVKLREAEDVLAEHEYIVGRFYQKKKAWVAGTNRMRQLLQRYPEFTEKDKVYYHLGRGLAKQGNPEEGRIYLQKLLADYPYSPYLPKARKVLKSIDEEEAAS